MKIIALIDLVLVQEEIKLNFFIVDCSVSSNSPSRGPVEVLLNFRRKPIFHIKWEAGSLYYRNEVLG